MAVDLRKRKGTLIFGQASVTIWTRSFDPPTQSTVIAPAYR